MWHRVYVVSLCFLYFVLPFSVLLILYCRICYILQSTDADAPNGSLKESSHCRNRRNLRIQVLNIIVCLVVLFFLFHLPYRVVSMWFIFANKEDLRDLGIETYFNVLYAARTLFYLNHSINPIIYNFVSTKFRNTLRGMISREDCQASIVSCHRRPGNTPFIRHKQSHHSLMIDHNMDKSSLIIKRTQVTRTSRRQKMNEFFPMYATVLQKQNDVDCGQC
ncbi:Serpentine type 7TM GPCR chemoreceptor Srsx [Mactra antiquata]